MKQLESGFKRSVNWNKHQSKLTQQAQTRYLDSLIDPSFQGVNKLFVLSFEYEEDRKVHTGYYLPKVEKKDYNMIDGKTFSISQLKVIQEHIIIFKKLQQVKEMITLLFVY